VVAILVLFCGWLPFRIPPDYPDLPPGYHEWQEYSYSVFSDSSFFYQYKKTHTLSKITDSFPIPFSIDVGSLIFANAKCDSVVGQIMFYSDPTNWRETKDRRQVSIQWYPHQERKLDSLTIMSYLMPLSKWRSYNAISLDSMGFQKIPLTTEEGYRIRGFWWDTQCDYSIHLIGSFVTYFISTEKLDFRITCSNTTYTYSPEGEDFGPEHYPNRITELEQAVEQTFRVK